jgi:hypothetical protein
MTNADVIELPEAGSVAYTDVVLFRLGGVDYMTTDRPRVALSLRYMRKVREVGEAEANAYLLEEMIGPEAYEALEEYDDLTTEQFADIMELVKKITVKALPGDGGPKAVKARKR